MTESFEGWRAAGKRFAFKGHSIFYRSGGRADGTGANLLCIHGLPTASWDYHRLWPELERSFACVIAPDMLGFGWSDKPLAHAYTIAEQADLHEQLLRDQGITRVRVLAHDYGATVAQELLARHHERLARGDTSLRLEAICFLNGGLFPETHRALLLQKLMLTPLGPWLARAMNERAFSLNFSRIFGPHTKPSPLELAQVWQMLVNGDGKRMFHRLFHYMPERRSHRPRWVGAMQQATIPLRLINGPLDPVSGEHLQVRYRELIKDADVVSLAGIGHYPQLEDPEGVWRAAQPILTAEA